MNAKRKPRKKEAKPRDTRPYVGESGRRFAGITDCLSSWGAMVLLALLTGFVIGFALYLLMNLSTWLTKLLWEGVGQHLGIPAFSLVACTLGGIVIGAWTHLSGNMIDDLETVLAQFKNTGSYRLKNPVATSVSFLLPLAFGGSVGFEAGLTGIICAGCCWIRDKLKLAGLRAASIADVTIAASLSAIFRTPFAGLVAGIESEGSTTLMTGDRHVDNYTMRREAKLVLYLSAAVGALGGIFAFSALFGGSAGLPHFAPIEAQRVELLWALPCLAAAYLLLLAFRVTEHATGLLARLLGDAAGGTIAKPVVAGIILGGVALALPLVLFPGEEQSHELMKTWTTMSAIVLLATGLLKACMTPMCISLGWRGGDLFPCIFSGVSFGYGLAAITGADPMLCVTVTTASFLAGVTRKPVLTLVILALCFPLESILWVGIAAVAGSILPLPRALEAQKEQ